MAKCKAKFSNENRAGIENNSNDVKPFFEKGLLDFLKMYPYLNKKISILQNEMKTR